MEPSQVSDAIQIELLPGHAAAVTRDEILAVIDGFTPEGIHGAVPKGHP
ncbi:MAG TPA: hypothetical protein VLX59_13155 [Acidimicrobiales bacterium]|nr:hypothetical protein [Acidimicrobiales bacterium]